MALTRMKYTRMSSKTSSVRMIAKMYRKGKRIFVTVPSGGMGVRKGWGG